MTSEQDIQRQILDWLLHQYPRAFIRKMALGAMRVAGGKPVPNPLAGMPDIFMLLDGKYIGFEVKRPGQKADPHQEAVHEWLRTAGGTVHIVTSLEQAQEAMNGQR